MKFLIVVLSTLALASAQVTTVTTTLGLNLVGNADGTATITVGAGPGVTIPATAVTAVKAVMGLFNTAISGVTAGSNTTIALPVSLNTGTGAVSLTFGGNTYTLDQATIAQAMALQGQVFQALMGVLPRPPTPPMPPMPPSPFPTSAPFRGFRGAGERRGGHHRG